MNNYIFCTVQRTGKTWIVDTLNRLGLGYGIELLTEFERKFAPGQARLNSAFEREGMAGIARAFADIKVAEGSTCIGVTLQWNNLGMIAAERRAAEVAGFVEALAPCTVFFLQRRDELAQAISHYLMFESGYCHSTSSASAKAQRSNVRYNRADIEKFLAFTRYGYTSWNNLFDAAGLSPVNLYYEDFIHDPVMSFVNLAERIAHCRLDPKTVVAAAAGHSRVSDEIDNAFRARYLAGE